MLIATKNNKGFMSTTLDSISQEFVAHFTKNPGKILDIGAAYGVTTHPCVQAGCEVLAVDMEPKHLEELRQTAPEGHLTTKAAQFPEELVLPEDTFDGVIISRVLHFLEGDVIITGLKKIKTWLNPGGKLYMINETPYIRTLGRLRKEYLARKAMGDKWPGAFHNCPSYEQPSMQHLPEFMNLQDEDTIAMALAEAGLKAQKIAYVPRPDFPSHMHLDGRESIGAIATKA